MSSIPRTVAATALALVLVGIAGWLGWWQLEAWQARRDAEARDLTELTPVAIDEVMGSDDPFPGNEVGRPVDVSGSWLPEGSFWVSDRVQDGRDGYWAVTPLELSGTDTAVLVVRGWSDAPDGELPDGAAELTGWLQPAEGTGAVDDDPDDDVVPQLRIADAVQRVDADLYGAYVVAQESRSRPGGGEPGVAAGGGQLHRAEEPVVRRGVVGLRRLRRLHLVALGARPAAADRVTDSPA